MISPSLNRLFRKKPTLSSVAGPPIFIMTTAVGGFAEVLRGETYGAPADAYSFGMVMYEVMSRRLPVRRAKGSHTRALLTRTAPLTTPRSSSPKPTLLTRAHLTIPRSSSPKPMLPLNRAALSQHDAFASRVRQYRDHDSCELVMGVITGLITKPSLEQSEAALWPRLPLQPNWSSA